MVIVVASGNTLIGSMYPWSRAASPPTMPGPTADSRNA